MRLKNLEVVNEDFSSTVTVHVTMINFVRQLLHIWSFAFPTTAAAGVTWPYLRMQCRPRS
jgi:hypothetical protein